MSIALSAVMQSTLSYARACAILILCAVGSAFTAPAFAASASDLDVKIQKVGEEFRATVSLFVRASRERVWDVVTDFERAPDFMRDLQVSKVVSRSGDTLRIFQKDQFRFGPFSFPVETVKDMRLVELVRTESHLVGGSSMKKYDSIMEFVSVAGGTRIFYRSQAIPDSAFAAFVGESMIKRETEERFRQLRAEILRREHIAAAKQ